MMPIMWSRIHAELGLDPCPLTYSMIARAVDEKVAENIDLDWKQALPADVEKKRWEFAKDVAMLANTRGGLIVFGVREVDERAQELVGVATGERHRQRLRALAYGRVRPMVNGLLIEALDDGNGERGLIVVFVPPSSDAPHVVGEKNEMGIPYREGTDTRWMTEDLLARAYRDRFMRRDNDRAALSTLVAELPDTGGGVWAFVSSKPAAPAPPQFGRPDPTGTISTMRALPALAAEVTGESSQRGPLINQLLDSAIGNPRIGLRRWVIQSDYYSTDPHATVDRAVVELHHDGSVALGVRVDRLMPAAASGEQPESEAEVSWVPIKLLDQLIVEAVALTALHGRSLGGVGTTLIRVGLRPDVHKAMVAVDNVVGGGCVSALLRPVPGSRVLRHAWDVETGFAVEDDVTSLRHAARQLADDLNHQFGIRASSVPG